MYINIEKLFSEKNATFIAKHYKQISFTSPRHYHNEYEIAFIKESNGKLFAGNNIVDFNAGDLFIFGPKLVHCFKNNKTKMAEYKFAQANIILFKKEFFGVDFLDRKEMASLKKLLINAEEGIQIVNPDPKIIRLILNLSKKEGLKSIINFISILDYLSSCNNKLLSLKFPDKHYYKLKDKLLNKILEYIEKNYSKELAFKEWQKIPALLAQG